MGVHFLEDAKTDAQVLDVVPQRFRCRVKPYLEVPTSMLLCRLLVSRRNHKVINNNQIPFFLICVMRWSHIIFLLVILLNVSESTKERKAIWRSIRIWISKLRLIIEHLPLRLCWITES